MNSKKKSIKIQNFSLTWTCITLMLGLTGVISKAIKIRESKSQNALTELKETSLRCIDGLIKCGDQCCSSCDACHPGCPGYDSCCKDKCYWETCRGPSKDVVACMLVCVPTCNFGNFRNECLARPC